MKMYLPVKGFSLIETIVALLLSTVLLVLLFKLHTTMKKNTDHQVVTSSMILNDETARALLQNDIREAGYMGCSQLTATNVSSTVEGISLNPENRIMGGRNKDSDSVTVQHISHPAIRLVTSPTDDGSTIIIPKISQFSKHDILLISDCEHGEIFAIKEIYQHGGNLMIVPQVSLHSHFNLPASVALFAKSTYFIAPTGRKDKRRKMIDALMKENILGERAELVPGISSMKIVYLINSAQTLNEFSAEAITDWSHVVGVKIVFDYPNKLATKLIIALRESMNE